MRTDQRITGLPLVNTATTTTLPMPVRRMGIMARAGLAAASLSVPGRGSAAAMASVAGMGFAVGTVTADDPATAMVRVAEWALAMRVEA